MKLFISMFKGILKVVLLMLITALDILLTIAYKIHSVLHLFAVIGIFLIVLQWSEFMAYFAKDPAFVIVGAIIYVGFMIFPQLLVEGVMEFCYYLTDKIG